MCYIRTNRERDTHTYTYCRHLRFELTHVYLNTCMHSTCIFTKSFSFFPLFIYAHSIVYYCGENFFFATTSSIIIFIIITIVGLFCCCDICCYCCCRLSRFISLFVYFILFYFCWKIFCHFYYVNMTFSFDSLHSL